MVSEGATRTGESIFLSVSAMRSTSVGNICVHETAGHIEIQAI